MQVCVRFVTLQFTWSKLSFADDLVTLLTTLEVIYNNNFYCGTQKNVKFSFTEVLSWISYVWWSGRVKKQKQNWSNGTLQSTHRNTKGRQVHDPLLGGKWLTYQSVLPILAILLLSRCSGTLSESCLTGWNWYGCILVGLSGQVLASSSELELAILQRFPRVT